MLGSMQAEPAAAPEAPPADGDLGSNVTPEEQAMYDKVVGNAHEIIYGPDNNVEPTILAHLKGEFGGEAAQIFEAVDPPLQNSPVDNVAASAVMLALFLDGNAEQAEIHIPDEVLFAAGQEIVEEMVTVAEAAAIHEFSEEEVEGAWYRALDLFRQASPRVDADALGEEFAQIANADKQGQIGQLLPGLPQQQAQGGA